MTVETGLCVSVVLVDRARLHFENFYTKKKYQKQLASIYT